MNDTALSPYRNHPGFDAQWCHLQYVVTPHLYSTSSHGFGCEVTCGHCIPGEHCAELRARHPVSVGTGEDIKNTNLEFS